MHGASKTMGLAKFPPNFTGLAVSFFNGYVHLIVSVSQTCLAESIFSRLRKPQRTDLFISYNMNLNNVGASQAPIENTFKSRSRK